MKLVTLYDIFETIGECVSDNPTRWATVMRNECEGQLQSTVSQCLFLKLHYCEQKTKTMSQRQWKETIYCPEWLIYRKYFLEEMNPQRKKHTHWILQSGTLEEIEAIIMEDVTNPHRMDCIVLHNGEPEEFKLREIDNNDYLNEEEYDLLCSTCGQYTVEFPALSGTAYQPYQLIAVKVTNLGQSYFGENDTELIKIEASGPSALLEAIRFINRKIHWQSMEIFHQGKQCQWGIYQPNEKTEKWEEVSIEECSSAELINQDWKLVLLK